MTVVTIANRLPVRRGDDHWELSPGGLVTALRPVMAAHAGAWVGWDGGTRGIPATLPDLSIRLMPVGLSAAQVRTYYHGLANATLWPLLHDAIEKPRFERAWWHGYQGVNAIFANAALTALAERPGALAWVHDYHLMLVPRLIRERRPDQPVGFFLHVPWPPPDIFARLPRPDQRVEDPPARPPVGAPDQRAHLDRRCRFHPPGPRPGDRKGNRGT